jgi:polyhydroxyalkanoate synthesis regulator phasin
MTELDPLRDAVQRLESNIQALEFRLKAASRLSERIMRDLSKGADHLLAQQNEREQTHRITNLESRVAGLESSHGEILAALAEIKLAVS